MHRSVFKFRTYVIFSHYILLKLQIYLLIIFLVKYIYIKNQIYFLLVFVTPSNLDRIPTNATGGLGKLTGLYTNTVPKYLCLYHNYNYVII